MDGGEVLGRAGWERAIELGQRARGRQLLGPLDQRPLELAPQVALEAVDALAVDRRPLGLLRRAPRLQAQRAADPLDVDADHAGALAAAAEGGDREPGEVSHLALAALRDRLADRLSKLVGVESLATLEPVALAQLAVDRLGLGGAEEVAVEDEVEDRGGRPGTWRRSPRAPRGSRRARSTGPSAAPRTRRGSRPCRPPPPRCGAPRRTRRAARRGPLVAGRWSLVSVMS